MARNFSSLYAEEKLAMFLKRKCEYCRREIDRGEYYIKVTLLKKPEYWCTDCGSIDENK